MQGPKADIPSGDRDGVLVSTCFQVESDYAGALHSACLDSFDAMMSAAGGAPSSRHAHRETVPIEIDVAGTQVSFFLKRTFRVPPRHGIRPWLRLRRGRSQPMHEWTVLGMLSAAGIPAMRRVACGERRVAGVPVAGFCLVEKVAMAHTLEDWLVPGFAKPAELTRSLRRRLAHGAGRLIGRLHRQGFLWPDAQAKHIFAAPTGHADRATWRFCLIDVERMQHVSNARDDERDIRGSQPALRDIRKLIASLRPTPLSRDDVIRFMAGYDGAGPRAARRHMRPASSSVEPIMRLISEPGPRLPDDFEHPRGAPWTRRGGMMADDRWVERLSRIGITGLESAMAFDQGESLSKSGLDRHRDRFAIVLSDGDGSTCKCYLKRYRKPPIGAQLRRIIEWRPGRGTAAREAHFAAKLASLGVGAPGVVAVGERMSGWRERCSFSVTREIRGESLETLVDRVRRRPEHTPAAVDRHEIIEQLACLVRVMHRHRLFHRDLYLCHVFLSRNADGQVVLQLIDLARMIEKPVRSWRWRIKDLGALDFSAPRPTVTRADRVRFLYHYDSVLRQGPSKADRASRLRRYARAVRARTHRTRRHERHRVNRLDGRRSQREANPTP